MASREELLSRIAEVERRRREQEEIHALTRRLREERILLSQVESPHYETKQRAREIVDKVGTTLVKLAKDAKDKRDLATQEAVERMRESESRREAFLGKQRAPFEKGRLGF